MGYRTMIVDNVQTIANKSTFFGLFDVFCVVMLLRSALLNRRAVVNRKSAFRAIDCGGSCFGMQTLLIQGLMLRRQNGRNLWFGETKESNTVCQLACSPEPLNGVASTLTNHDPAVIVLQFTKRSVLNRRGFQIDLLMACR
jgi:hypothetical protein